MAVRVVETGAALSCRNCDPALRRARNCPPGTNPAFRAVIGGMVVDTCPHGSVTTLSWAILRRRGRRAFFAASEHDTTEALAQGFEIVDAEIAAMEAEGALTPFPSPVGRERGVTPRVTG